MVVALVAGVAIAALTGVALARSFTLQVVKHAKVTDTAGVSKREAVVSDAHGVSLYELSHDTLKHRGCTNANGCFNAWPPATAAKNAKLTMASGVKGKLRLIHHDGINQLTLDNHPLYAFSGDAGQKGIATGEGILHFGGTWHVVLAAASKKGTKTQTTTTTSTTTTMTSTSSSTTYCYYPPCH